MRGNNGVTLGKKGSLSLVFPPQACTSRWSQQDTDQQHLFITNLILL